MARLGDICEIYTGTGFPVEYQGNATGTYPFYKVGDISKNVVAGKLRLCLCDNYIDDEVAKTLKGTIVPEGTVVFAKIGEAVKLNRRAITSSRCLIDNNIMGIKPHPGFLDLSFFYHFMCNLKLEKLAEATTIPSIKKTVIEKIEVPAIPIATQKEIAAVLDKVSDLIALRKQQLAKLDELVKARFVEMFGDPILNSLGWDQELLSNVTSKIGSGATPKGGKESYKEDGISLIRSMNVHDGRFDYKDLAHITDQQAKQLDGVTVEKDDVFINITGASVARSCIVPTDVLPARVNQHVSIIRCKSDRLNPIFANNLFLNSRFKDLLLSIGESGGATRQAITKQQLEALTVIVPPLPLQVYYANFAEQINQSKSTVQQGLDKLETLKFALMQEYFG